MHDIVQAHSVWLYSLTMAAKFEVTRVTPISFDALEIIDHCVIDEFHATTNGEFNDEDYNLFVCMLNNVPHWGIHRKDSSPETGYFIQVD